MTKTDEERLAQIRAHVEMWIVICPEAKDWDSAFLLKILDAKSIQGSNR